MNKEHLITVIIPIYNVEKYLDRCIQSVVGQTYKNLEIILVDDGSPDGCPLICDEWAKRDIRIKVIHKKNGGLSDARNTGLSVAKGEYIGFVDSDDYILPEMYEKLMEAIQQTRADLAICDCERVYDRTGGTIYDVSPIRNEILNREQALEKLAEKHWWHYVVAWNKLYTRKSLKNVRFPVGKIHEDQFVIHEVFANCDKIICLEEKFYRYVQRSGGITTSGASVKHLDSVEALCRRYDYYKKSQMLELYAGAYKGMEGEYASFRGALAGHWLSWGDWRRAREIDKMFCERFFEQPKVEIGKRIRYSIPDISFLIQKVYRKLHIARIVGILKKIKRYLSEQKGKQAVLIDTPTHGNLGDQAIVLSEMQLLQAVTPDLKYIELTASQIHRDEKFYAMATPMNRDILVPGGGFLGALWPEEEYRFRRIVQAFHKNRIIVFPQTVTFDLSTEEGKAFLKESQEIYSAHPDLTIFVREKKSYTFMKEYFPKVNCVLVPDIVMLMNAPIKPKKRSGVLFCMRHDLEKTLNRDQLRKMQDAVHQKYPEEIIEFTDTVIHDTVQPDNRKEKVYQKLEHFAAAKLVVTDRLHGMIFAAITNTPCIAMSNCNGKVKGVYDWIKENEYVRFADSTDDFMRNLDTLDLEQMYTYNRVSVDNKFEPVYKELGKL